MSNLKDTDIDDLFRRASDKYPLRTDSADWDRMAAALENKGPIPPDGPVAPEEKRKRRFFWLFFLLLPLAGAGYYAWHHAGNTGKAVASGINTTTNTSTGTTTSTGTASNTTVADPDHTTTPATAPATAPATPTTAPATVSAVSTPGVTASNTSVTASNTAAPAKNGSSRFSAAHGRQHSGRTTGIGQNSTAGISTDGISTDENSTTADPIAASLLASNPTTGDRLFYDLQRAPIPRDYRLAVNVTSPAAKKDSTAKPKDKTKHFYAGVFGSPDLSTVKMQAVKGVGTTFGIILGYTFNNGHWAIETGVYVDRKKYYTEGEYFSTKEINLPTNSWLTDVDGTCYMWEIPLNARYNFNPGAKTSWFATAGLSTYLMTRENYSYGLEWPGSTTPYDASRNYHKPSQYPFSIINLSAGFEQRLGKIGNLRIEPYVRVPLTGLGTGKLPIMSAGVNIGITRQLW